VTVDLRQDAPKRRQERTEDEQERLNRQLEELLNEVRVAMPGVQVLFGFLLAVPFQQGFDRSPPASASCTSRRCWPRPWPRRS